MNYTENALAKLSGLDRRTVALRLRPIATKGGRYRLEDAMPLLCQRADEEKTESAREMRARLQSELLKMDVAERKGLLVLMSAVREVWTDCAVRIKDGFLHCGKFRRDDVLATFADLHAELEGPNSPDYYKIERPWSMEEIGINAGRAVGKPKRPASGKRS